jgi:hypothetical protein
MEINTEKTRVMAFRGMEPIRSKICINNKTLKQNTFNYMGYNRIPKMILKYEPKGKRNLGRPLKRWKDSVL